MELLHMFHEDIEADMQRVYGIDIGEFWAGRITFRRLETLLYRLPPESLFVHAAQKAAEKSKDDAQTERFLQRQRERGDV